ncbi:uncharacterized protein LOC144113202 isoform X2 [Amblyomma americanum]
MLVTIKRIGKCSILMNTFIRCENCCIGSNSLFKDCHLEASEVVIANNCYINGLTVNVKDEALVIPANSCVLQKESRLENFNTAPVVIAFGMDDHLGVEEMQPAFFSGCVGTPESEGPVSQVLEHLFSCWT